MRDFQAQLQAGLIQKAYRALLSSMMGLRARYADKFGDQAVSAIYQGYLDMTYFAIFPPALKIRGLKIAIVFNYEMFRFEAWLAARNRKLQERWWNIFKNLRAARYRIVEPKPGIDSIIEFDLAQGLEMAQSRSFTAALEQAADTFIKDMENQVSSQSDHS